MGNTAGFGSDIANVKIYELSMDNFQLAKLACTFVGVIRRPGEENDTRNGQALPVRFWPSRPILPLVIFLGCEIYKC